MKIYEVRAVAVGHKRSVLNCVVVENEPTRPDDDSEVITDLQQNLLATVIHRLPIRRLISRPTTELAMCVPVVGRRSADKGDVFVA